MNKRIGINDEVCIFLLNGDTLIGSVIDRPEKSSYGEVGHYWIIEDNHKNIHYIQNFSHITKYFPKINKNDEVPF